MIFREKIICQGMYPSDYELADMIKRGCLDVEEDGDFCSGPCCG